ncbi:MAG: SBBP repeat-containing protein, partial [candidate division WOR-3 bacterium]
IDNFGNVYVTGESYSNDNNYDYATVKYDVNGNQQWIARYNGPGNGNDYAYAIAVDNFGNIYVTGESDGISSFSDFATIKYSPDGVELWVQRYNGVDNDVDWASGLWIDNAGNVYVVGTSCHNITDNDYTTIKYDANGTCEWIRFYDGPASYDDNAYSIVGDLAGNVYITGESYGDETDLDFCTIKYNASGVELWVQRYDSPDHDEDCAYGIAIDNQGNVYVVGESFLYISNYDYLTIKYDNNGVQQWVQRYNGLSNNNDFGVAIATDNFGNIYVTGQSYNPNNGYDIITVKYNANGIQQWAVNYNSNQNFNDDVSALITDIWGNVYVGGVSPGFGTYDDGVIVKYNSAGTQQWFYRYNGQGMSYEETEGIARDNQNNIYVFGASEGDGTYFDYTLVKYNTNGEQQWVTRYNGLGNQNDLPYGIAIDNQNNIYLTGESYGLGTDFDYALVKYNSAGILQWVQRYNGSANRYDQSSAIAIDNQGNIYITGVSEGLTSDYDYLTIKYDNNGIIQWIVRYNGPSNGVDYATALTVDSYGNVYVTGVSYKSTSGYDYLTIKYNANGETLWTRRYNGPANYSDGAFAIAVDSFGNVYVTGRSIGIGTNRDWATIKYNSQGDELWVQRYNGTADRDDFPRALAIDNLGNIYVTGCAENINTNKDIVTVKYLAEGNVQWVSVYNGNDDGNDEALAIAIDNFNNIYLTGYSYHRQTDGDYIIIKYNADGNVQGIAQYNGPANRFDKGVGLAIDNDNCIYVTGKSYGLNTSYDFATIKYQTITSLPADLKVSNYQRNSLSVYPNPMRNCARINYYLTTINNVHLSIFDISGREVKNFSIGKKTSGKYAIVWDGTDEHGQKLNSGIYFLILNTDSGQITQKIQIIR